MAKYIQMNWQSQEEDLDQLENRYNVTVEFTVSGETAEDVKRYIKEKIDIMLNVDLDEFEDIKYSKYNPDRDMGEIDMDKEDAEPRIIKYQITDTDIAEVD